MKEATEKFLSILLDRHPEIYDEIEREVEDEDMVKIRRIAQDRIDEAQAAIDNLSWVHDDPTGQDAECQEMDDAIADKLRAEDHYIRDTDPDRYAEMKYMYGDTY